MGHAQHGSIRVSAGEDGPVARVARGVAVALKQGVPLVEEVQPDGEEDEEERVRDDEVPGERVRVAGGGTATGRQSEQEVSQMGRRKCLLPRPGE